MATIGRLPLALAWILFSPFAAATIGSEITPPEVMGAWRVSSTSLDGWEDFERGDVILIVHHNRLTIVEFGESQVRSIGASSHRLEGWQFPVGMVTAREQIPASYVGDCYADYYLPAREIQLQFRFTAIDRTETLPLEMECVFTGTKAPNGEFFSVSASRISRLEAVGIVEKCLSEQAGKRHVDSEDYDEATRALLAEYVR